MIVRVYDIGETCVALAFEARVDPPINEACEAMAGAVADLRLPGVRDVVATYHTVAVHFDPLTADRGAVVEALERAARTPGRGPTVPAAVHDVPACYGGEYGPDLGEVARFAKCSEQDVVRLHGGLAYRVYMMGFLPGFPYLASVDPRLRLPRHQTPRPRVPAGSVAIAGFQTGIYPLESPGGWRVIGRTWIRPFDLARERPLLFSVGDRVRFVPVGPDDFARAIEAQG